MRFAAMDIEATRLDATLGRLLCCCFKFFDEDKVRTIIVRKLANEKKAVQKILDTLKEVDILVTWNGKHYDVPFLNACCLAYRLEPVPSKLHLDLLPHHRYYFRTLGHSLDASSAHAQLLNRKYHTPMNLWRSAAEGDKESIAEVIKHCEQDVRVTEEMCRIMAPYIRNITR